MKRQLKKSNLKRWNSGADIASMEKAIKHYETRISTLTDEGEIEEAQEFLAFFERSLEHFKQTNTTVMVSHKPGGT